MYSKLIINTLKMIVYKYKNYYFCKIYNLILFIELIVLLLLSQISIVIFAIYISFIFIHIYYNIIKYIKNVYLISCNIKKMI